MTQTRTQAICKGIFGWSMGFNWAGNFNPYHNPYKKSRKKINYLKTRIAGSGFLIGAVFGTRCTFVQKFKKIFF